MRFKCAKCQHVWNQTLEEGAQTVQCPACQARFSLKKKKPASKPAPPPERTQAPETEATQAVIPPSAEKTQALPQQATQQIPVDQTAQEIQATQALENQGGTQSIPSGSGSGSQSEKIAQSLAHLAGQTLGGYEIKKLLGAGGMGAVFLARQVSLDRDVALKILPEDFAQKPDALARFTREALSAAQLNHHNIVQVFDVGSDQGYHFIAMEFVRGETLADIIRRDGRFLVDDAASYALQTARGLHYAHQRQIIHRDIKPDNLMLNENGVIKIADMGLAKMLGKKEEMPSGKTLKEELQKADPNLTLAHRGLGTPAYMPPEQARDARKVDAKADQYSLGCTLYYLCAGKAPYSGTTAFEMITKHMREAMTPLDTHVRNVPEAFSRIIEKMLAKKPEDRYENMEAVIQRLEEFLGLEGEKGAGARERHLAILEEAQKEYYAAPMVRVRKQVKAAFGGGVFLLFLASIFLGNFALAGGALGLAVLTPLCHFLLHGFKTKNYLFRRVRSVFFGMPLKSWALFIGGAVLAVAVLFMLSWLLPWMAFAVVAFGLAAAYEFGMVKKLQAQREGALEKTKKVLRELRLRGFSEEALQDFVCRFSGKDWEEFFEEFFGYEAMIFARGKWAKLDKATPRKKTAAWREPMARWLDEVEEARREARERRQLAKVEAQRFKAEGVSEKEARRKADQEAESFMEEEKVKKEKQKKAAAQKSKTHPESQYVEVDHPRSGLPLWANLARLALGLLMALAAVVKLGPQYGVALPEPPFLAKWLEAYYAQGHGGNLVGLAAGLILLISFFFKGFLPAVMMTAGALVLAGANLWIKLADQALFNSQTAFILGAGLSAGGLVLAIMEKMKK